MVLAADLTSSQLARLRKDTRVVSIESDAVAAVIPDVASKPAAPPVDDSPQVVRAAFRRVGVLESPTARVDTVDERVDVDIAVFDSGISNHPDLNIAGGVDCAAGPGYDDRDGHGTGVAGIAAAIDNNRGIVGIAPGARLWSVRVANSGGSISDSALLCGIDWTTAHADTIEVANLSLSGPLHASGACGATAKNGKPLDPIHDAICRSVAAGVTYVVAAGNDAVDSQYRVPASYDEVITVSAFADTDGLPGGLGAYHVCLSEGADDRFAWFSNFGADVDIAAPGVCVSSTYTNGEYAFSDGTCFSSPFVAGAAALYIANHPEATPAEVRLALVDRAEPGPIAGDPNPYPEGVLNVRGL